MAKKQPAKENPWNQLNPDSRIECYSTGNYDCPVSVHMDGNRVEMPLVCLFALRAAINQWLAEHPDLANPHLASVDAPAG